MSQSQPPLSQELDARFSVFLNPIRDLTKNWEVDIAKYLEEYLEELAGVTISLDGGVTPMNFAEAAMLIQGSVTVYSKKVDFLWQMVLKTLDLLSSRRALEDNEMEAGAGMGGGGRRSRMEVVHSFSCIDSIKESHNIELREDDDDNDSRRKSVKFLPSTPLNLIEKEVEKSQNRISLRMRTNELLGAKDDFRITRSYLTPQGVLHLEVPSEMLDGRANATTTTSTSTLLPSQRTEAASVATDIPEMEIRAESDQDEPPPLEDDCMPPEDDPLPPEEDPPPPAEDPPPLAEDPPPPSEDPPPPATPIEDPDLNHHNNNNNEMAIEFPKQRYGLRKRKDEAEVVATLKMTDKLKPFDPNADCPPKRPPRAGRLRVPTPCPCHRPSESKRQKNKKNKNLASKSYLPLEEFITSELKDIISKKNKKERTKKIPPEILEKAAEEETNRINIAKEKVVQRLGEEGVSREEALQVAEEATQEDRVSPNIEDEDDPLMSDAPVDLDLDNTGFVLPEAHPGREFPEGGTVAAAARLNDSVVSEEPSSEYEALVLKWVADYVNSAQESIKSTDLERRVNQWRKTVVPKLQAEEKRTEFDIHRYGSQILSQFPNDGRKQTISFRQSMKGQDDPREVSRFFLSCLMLANSHNVELSTSDPDDFAMDCLELTLKSRVRHHEELEEYMAPLQASARSSETEMEYQSHRGPPAVCADITQTTNLQNEANIITKKGCGKKRALPR